MHNGNFKNEYKFSIIRFIGLVLAPVIIAGLLANIFATIRGSDGAFTFSYLLDLVSTYEAVLPEFSFETYHITGSWGVFNFLKVFFEFFANAFAIIGFLCVNLVNLIKFLLHFIVGLFAF